MLYAILIHGTEADWATMPPEAMQQAMTAFATYNADLARAAVLRAAHQFAPSGSAVTVRAANGGTTTSAGVPEATRQQLSGMYLVDVATADDAVAWAGRCPAVWGGASVEVRPVLPTPAAA